MKKIINSVIMVILLTMVFSCKKKSEEITGIEDIKISTDSNLSIYKDVSGGRIIFSIQYNDIEELKDIVFDFNLPQGVTSEPPSGSNFDLRNNKRAEVSVTLSDGTKQTFLLITEYKGLGMGNLTSLSTTEEDGVYTIIYNPGDEESLKEMKLEYELPMGATGKPASGENINIIEGSKTIDITFFDQTNKAYTIQAKLNQSNDAIIDEIKYTIDEIEYFVVIYQEDKTGVLELPFGTMGLPDPEMVYSQGAVVTVEITEVDEVMSSLKYTITSEDGSIVNDYNVNVIIDSGESTKAITSFYVTDGNMTYQGIINETEKTILVEPDYGTVFTGFTYTAVHTGISISPIDGSGITLDDSNKSIFTVTAQDISHKDYTLEVKNKLNSEAVISSIAYTIDETQYSAIIDQANKTGTLDLPYGTVSLPELEISHSEGASVVTDITMVDEAISYIKYIVTAEDTSTKEYILTVSLVYPNYRTTVGHNGTDWVVDQAGSYIGIWFIEDLQNLNSYLSDKYVLMRDLDFNSEDSYRSGVIDTNFTSGVGWTPIAGGSTPFTGQFKGNHKSISNLYIDDTNGYYKGLFGSIKDSRSDINENSDPTIDNLEIIDSYINCADSSGTLAYAFHNGIIDNCKVTGNSSITGYSSIGGLIGAAGGLPFNTYISNCYSEATVTGVIYIGGLIGISNAKLIENCYNKGSVNGNWLVGGLIGQSEYKYDSNNENNPFFNIVSCYNEGDITSVGVINGSSGQVGGLIGRAYNVNILKSYSTGNIEGKGRRIGGLIGEMNALIQNYILSQSYSTGNVDNDYTGNSTGGLIGYTDEIDMKDCYSIGNVTSLGQKTGGLIGYGDTSNINNCYATGDITGGVGSLGNFVGGLVGDAITTHSKIINSIAFNDNIQGYDNPRRISDDATFTNNYANENINISASGTYSGIDIGLNSPDGANMTATEMRTETFFTTPANWYNGVWDFSIWEIKSGAVRPTLKNTGNDNGANMRTTAPSN
ncbi:MAG: hypothetical protein HRT66_08425 [Flavobacteriaceae bacterium]|nr:hypothetical protein [Flavobacteriaceae bacterium]